MQAHRLFASLSLSLLAIAVPLRAADVETIVLENDAVRAEIVPAWAGRLMSFGRPGGGNVLWTQPEAADFGCHPSGKPRWKNVGGEKTWVGSDPAAWRAFEGVETGRSGRRPPPTKPEPRKRPYLPAAAGRGSPIIRRRVRCTARSCSQRPSGSFSSPRTMRANCRSCPT